MEDAGRGDSGEHLDKTAKVDGEWCGELASCSRYHVVSAGGRDWLGRLKKSPGGCDSGHMAPVQLESFSPDVDTREKELISATGDLAGDNLTGLGFVSDVDIEAWVRGTEVLLVDHETDLERQVFQDSQI